MKNPFLPIDLVFLVRPMLLIPVWGFCIFGYYQGMSVHGTLPLTSFWTIHSLKVFAWIVLFSLSVGAVYILNQLADIDVDNANDGIPLLATGKVSLGAAKISVLVSVAISVIAPFFAYPVLSIFSCCAVILGCFYSFKPIRFSGRLGLDFLSNATGYGIIAFGAGWHLSGAPVTFTSFPLSAFPYFLLMCSGSISSTIPDIKGDKKYGKNTTAVILGVIKAHVLATLLLVLAGAIAFLKYDYIAVTCALCGLPCYVLYFIYRRPRIQEATYKIGGFLSMAIASALMPILGVSAIIVTALTFIYFKTRHRINYPTLAPVTHEE
jgi:4-hydroxybenzoate polyprenyltransferase